MISTVQFEVKDQNTQPAGKWIGGYAIITNISKRLRKIKYLSLHPDYADLYVQFIGKGKKLHRSIYFLKGNLNPALFYGVFVNRYWQNDEQFIICDYSDEIFYVFNVNQNDYSMKYEPVNNTLEELKDYIKVFEKDTSVEETARLRKLRR